MLGIYVFKKDHCKKVLSNLLIFEVFYYSKRNHVRMQAKYPLKIRWKHFIMSNNVSCFTPLSDKYINTSDET